MFFYMLGVLPAVLCTASRVVWHAAYRLPALSQPCRYQTVRVNLTCENEGTALPS